MEKNLKKKDLNDIKKIKKRIHEEMIDIEKEYDVSDWTDNYLEPGRMESEEAFNRGYYEAMQVIKNIIEGKK